MGDLMRMVFWTLGRRRYAGHDEFVEPSTSIKLRSALGEWLSTRCRPRSRAITVTYTAMWKDVDDTLEVPLGEPGRPLTWGGRLFPELNNATVEFFADADHCFFEGLVAKRHQESTGCLRGTAAR